MRTSLPRNVAAQALFLSDRTCCVCRKEGKPIQIHHVDDDPSNHAPSNLAVLCFDCHNDTLIQGGFGRKLNSDQIILYREDWHRLVAQNRASKNKDDPINQMSSGMQLVTSTSIAEIYRENKEFELLAIHYDSIGNIDLRDKYIEIALAENPSDDSVCFLRGLQHRPECIPDDVVGRELESFSNRGDNEQKARLLATVGRYPEAAICYVKGIRESLESGNIFSAAFYIKELANKGVLKELFLLARVEAERNQDIWLEVRALQELGWKEELQELLLERKAEIRLSDNPMLQSLLAQAEGDQSQAFELEKQIAQSTHVVGRGVVLQWNKEVQKTSSRDDKPS